MNDLGGREQPKNCIPVRRVGDVPVNKRTDDGNMIARPFACTWGWRISITATS
jgi:hypothetical protein